MSSPTRSARTRIPSLGPHGEGWVALQSVLFVVLIVSGTLGPSVDGLLRVVLTAMGTVLLIVGIGVVVSGYARQGRQFTTLPRPRGKARLIEDGPYRYVRHPMYGGIVMAAFGWALCTTSPVTLLFAIVTLAFFALKSRREEAWLEERFPGYAAYRMHTKRLIPFVY